MILRKYQKHSAKVLKKSKKIEKPKNQPKTFMYDLKKINQNNSHTILRKYQKHSNKVLKKSKNIKKQQTKKHPNKVLK